jgi:YD repeat-containing protein
VTQTLSSAPGGQVATAYGYDVHGNLTSVTDPNGNVTSYVYDDFGRMISQTSPVVTGVTTYVRCRGHLTTMTDAKGATTTRTYDPLGRVLTAVTTCNDTEVVSWS